MKKLHRMRQQATEALGRSVTCLEALRKGALGWIYSLVVELQALGWSYRPWGGVTGLGVELHDLGWSYRTWGGVTGLGVELQALGWSYRPWGGVT